MKQRKPLVGRGSRLKTKVKSKQAHAFFPKFTSQSFFYGFFFYTKLNILSLMRHE